VNVRPGTLDFAAGIPGVSPHNWQAAVGKTGRSTHKASWQAPGAAASLLDLLTSPELMHASRSSFARTPRHAVFHAARGWKPALT